MTRTRKQATVMILLSVMVLSMAAVPGPSSALASIKPTRASTWHYASVVAHALSSAGYQSLPLAFEPNRGQATPQVKFLARASGYSLSLTERQAIFAFARPTTHPTLTPGLASTSMSRPHVASVERTVVRMTLAGASASSRIEGLQQLPGRVNYLIGRNAGDWHTDIPTYAMIRYRNVYPGIDLVYRSTGDNLEYDFVVAPYADTGSIRLQFSGPRNLHVDRHGDLVLPTSAGQVRDRRPAVYQLNGGVRHAVSGRYVLGREGAVRFWVGAHDQSKPLIIDPLIVFTDSANLPDGGVATSVAVDGSGNIYVAGSYVPGSAPCIHVCTYVVELTPNDTPVYTTYLVSGGDTIPGGIGIDSQGQAVVVGKTLPNLTDSNASGSFPIVNSANPNPGGGPDAFVAKLQPDGNGFVYATYLGGSGSDEASAVAVGADGSAYVTGQTGSPDFQPMSASAYQPNFNPVDCLCGAGYFPEAFVAKFGPNGEWVYSTYLSGTDVTVGTGIAVDSAGHAVVTGNDSGAHGTTPFPTTASPDPANPKTGAFVTMLDNVGQHLVYSAFVGSAFDAHAVTLDGDGDADIAGRVAAVSNQGLPVTEGYITELSPTGGSILHSRVFDGDGQDVLLGIAVDGFGSVYVTGGTTSTSFLGTTPTSPGVVVKLDPSLSWVQYIQYLPGSGGGRGIALDSSGSAYVAAGYLAKLGPWTSPPLIAVGGSSPGPGPFPVWHGATTQVQIANQCPGGTGSFTVTQGTTTLASGSLTEGPRGTYSGFFGLPVGAAGQINILISCPNDATYGFVASVFYIDPSGTVQDAAGFAIGGATVTLYAASGPSGPFMPVPNGDTTVMSPANTTNPFTTTDDGLFGWDVVPGYYQIRASKTGCASAANPAQSYVETDVLTVPPPVTGLVLTLNCGGGSTTDTTPPVITPTVTGTKGTNGWYTSDVAVSWSVTDPESAILLKSGCDATSIAGDTAGTTFTCTATSAGGTGSQSVTIERDATPPTVSGAPDRPADHGGWYNHPVTVTWSAGSDLSGIVGCDSPTTYSGPDSGTAATTGDCTDRAGNVGAGSLSFQYDATKPTVTANLSPRNPASTGWYNTATGAPSVSFTCGDITSGIGGTCPGSHPFGEGANQSYSANVSDKAGNSNSAGVSGVNVDLTPPTVTYSGNAGTYTVDQTVSITCKGADTLSGVASTTCKDITGPAYAFSIGNNAVSANATDKAGNPGSGSTSFVVHVTYGSLCTVTKQLIQSSAKYQALPPSARAWIDQQATVLCQYLSTAQIALTPAQKAAAIALYQKGVAALVPLGWLTQKQADILTRLSSGL